MTVATTDSCPFVANFTIVVDGKSLHAPILNLATELSKILFHYILFCDKENRDLWSKIYFFSFGKISRFAGPLNIFVSLLVPVNKKILMTKFEMEEENTK